jgi:hypothetical protein
MYLPENRRNLSAWRIEFNMYGILSIFVLSTLIQHNPIPLKDNPNLKKPARS